MKIARYPKEERQKRVFKRSKPYSPIPPTKMKKISNQIILLITLIYLIGVAGKIFEFPKKRKDLVSLFPDKKADIENFLKTNKIDFDNANDLIRIANFANNL